MESWSTMNEEKRKREFKEEEKKAREKLKLDPKTKKRDWNKLRSLRRTGSGEEGQEKRKQPLKKQEKR